ncbi:hypothetical protein [Mangrovibacter sp. MFB070]|uniref:hypothetical protein n=1 Tax=Mangrovibacter sp. MFB070 TaxID=1224318 RepID=UPI001F459DF9|nr:hypothetical protein [Mangrovibacter sp. MFB070]
MRRSEIAGLQSRFIDLDRRVVHLPDTENGNLRDVHLSSKTILLLRSIQNQATKPNDRVF